MAPVIGGFARHKGSLRRLTGLRGGICLPTAYVTAGHIRQPGPPIQTRHPIAPGKGAGILACFPSATRFRLALGADSPRDDYHCPGTLGLAATMFFTLFVVTNCGILSSMRSSAPFGTPSTLHGMLSYHAHCCASRASVHGLAPLHFRRRAARPVSYYALFKWWLLLSQHPGCLRDSTSFPTEP